MSEVGHMAHGQKMLHTPGEVGHMAHRQNMLHTPGPDLCYVVQLQRTNKPSSNILLV